jgi:aryl-alcohol dehydrogenase-like predicted oxidoreductase
VRNSSRPSSAIEVERSLRRLGVERIDLYQIHWPDETGTPVEDSWGEMAGSSTRARSGRSA